MPPILLCPLENSAEKWGDIWTQVRPHITQRFGNRLVVSGKEYYAQWGMKGHNGVDLRAAVGTPIYAPVSGTALASREKDGYGWNIRLRSADLGLEIVLAHLSSFAPGLDADGTKRKVLAGEFLGLTGGAAGAPGSGSSMGAHLHVGVRRLEIQSGVALFQAPVRDYGNGFCGYFDPAPLLATFKGTLVGTDIAGS